MLSPADFALLRAALLIPTCRNSKLRDEALALVKRVEQTPTFVDDVRALVIDHYSGLPEDRPDESVWARLDALLFDDEGNSLRVWPDYEAKL
jgi:hypothetical protein